MNIEYYKWFNVLTFGVRHWTRRQEIICCLNRLLHTPAVSVPETKLDWLYSRKSATSLAITFERQDFFFFSHESSLILNTQSILNVASSNHQRYRLYQLTFVVIILLILTVGFTWKHAWLMGDASWILYPDLGDKIVTLA